MFSFFHFFLFMGELQPEGYSTFGIPDRLSLYMYSQGRGHKQVVISGILSLVCLMNKLVTFSN